MTVVLRPLTRPPAPDRRIILLLISEQALDWMLEAEGLATQLSVLVQVCVCLCVCVCVCACV